jgi:N-acetyl-anhydromuramyl-L-alanine amidase AmpD
MEPKYIIVHHTASNQETTTKENVNAWHRVRGFPKSSRGYYIGYHFLILANSMFQARDEDEIGAHTYVQGEDWNSESLGVCLAGNFEINDKLTDFQVGELTRLLTLLMETHKIDAKHLLIHRDVSYTACPGRYIDKNFLLFLIGWREYYQKKRTWKSWLEERKVAKEQRDYFGRPLTELEIRAIVYGRYGRSEVRRGEYSLFKGKYES